MLQEQEIFIGNTLSLVNSVCLQQEKFLSAVAILIKTVTFKPKVDSSNKEYLG